MTMDGDLVATKVWHNGACGLVSALEFKFQRYIYIFSHMDRVRYALTYFLSACKYSVWWEAFVTHREVAHSASGRQGSNFESSACPEGIVTWIIAPSSQILLAKFACRPMCSTVAWINMNNQGGYMDLLGITNAQLIPV